MAFDFSEGALAVNVPSDGATAMISLFRRNPLRDAAERAYQRVVAQSRRPEFFTACGVPDTLDGRFELICLHAFLYLCRLKGEAPPASTFGQGLFDAMFADFDRSLRELGTGDLSVGREVKRMAEAFYGRIDAYDRGLEDGGVALKAALTRNLFRTAPVAPSCIDQMATYVRNAATRLRDQDTAALLAGDVSFDPPLLRAAEASTSREGVAT